MEFLIKSKIGVMGLLCVCLMCVPNASSVVMPINDDEVEFMRAMVAGKVNELEQKANTQESIISYIAQDDIVKNMTPLFKCWVDFLCGCTIDTNNLKSEKEGPPPYRSTQLFRNDTDQNLESNHNYVQVVFPNQKVGVANKNLFLDSNNLMINKLAAMDVWYTLIGKYPLIAYKIRLNTMLNASRMFRFWGLEYATNANGEIILRTGNWPDAKKKLSPDDHNNLRVTRILLTLKMLSLNNIKNVFLKALKDNQGRLDGTKSIRYWLNVAEDNNNIDNPTVATTAAATNNSNAFVTGVTSTNVTNTIQSTSKGRKMSRKYRKIRRRRKLRRRRQRNRRRIRSRRTRHNRRHR